jgi:hypothetical protein
MPKELENTPALFTVTNASEISLFQKYHPHREEPKNGGINQKISHLAHVIAKGRLLDNLGN